MSEGTDAASSPDHKAQYSGIAAMAATAFLWSLGGLFIKIIDWNPFAIAGVRSVISSLVILAWLRRPKISWSFPQTAAALAYTATMVLFVIANKTTTAANAILLQYVAPAFTAVIGVWLLKERVRREQWIALFFIAGGMVLMFSDRLGGGRLLGNCLAVLSGLAFSFYMVFMRMQKEGSPLESVLLSHWFTAVIGLGIALFMPRPTVTWASLGAVGVLGVFQVGAAAILFSAAIKRIPAVSACLIGVLEPVLNPLWVFLVLGEAPGPAAIAGGAIILAAVTWASIAGAGRASRVA